MSGIIDMWAPLLPIPEIASHIRTSFPHQMLGYLRVFFKLPPQASSLGPFVDAMGGGVPFETMMAGLDEAGIDRVLITGFDEKSSCGQTFMPNDLIASIVRKRPERFIPFCGIDILTGMTGVRELERLVREEGFRGLSLRPFMIGLEACDRRYYPFYTKCVELGIPLSIHASANWTEVRTSDLGHPRHFDTVACDFPELQLILSHGGYPWVLEAVQLAWKHPNLYLELAAHRPRYLARPGTGWEPLLTFGNTVIRDKVLWGSGLFLLGRPPSLLVEEFKALPLEPPTLDAWLGGNARRLLGLS